MPGYLLTEASDHILLENSNFLLLEGATYSDVVLADSPVVYWRLGANYALDSGPNNIIGMGTQSTPPLSAAGLLVGDSDTCRDFIGTGFYAGGNVAVLNISYPMSIEAWCVVDSLAGYQCIYRKDPFDYAMELEAGKPAFYFNSGSLQAAYASTTLSIATRYHLVMTDDGTSVRWYINGALDATVARPAAGTPIPVGSGAYGIGAKYGAGSPGDYFDGRIDEVALYASALSQARVTAHYNTGIGVAFSGSLPYYDQSPAMVALLL